jgi:hypothetical protein
MKSASRFPVLIFSMLLILTILTTSFSQVQTVKANDIEDHVALGLIISPTGTITDKTPTYKWKKMTGATEYRYQVYNLSSSTPLIDRKVKASTCGSLVCTSTPAIPLAYGKYKWRIREFNGGVWTTWSTYQPFAVAPLYSDFNGTKAGWVKLAGANWPVSSTVLYSAGLPSWNSVYYNLGQYSNFDYSARVRRTGGIYNDGSGDQYPFSNIAIRTGTNFDPVSKSWYPGYFFGYTNSQYYYIGKTDETGNATFLQEFTLSSAIKPNDWNVLRVVATGSTFKFYINGTLVKTVSDSTRSTGFVGSQFYVFEGGSTTKYEIDWAQLIPISTP